MLRQRLAWLAAGVACALGALCSREQVEQVEQLEPLSVAAEATSIIDSSATPSAPTGR